ncbi:MAG: DUF4340 domain-containing protein [Eubacteriales bacterium]|nr:DUF4340 domain-containing protein [Eubacteriales bacterium]
MQPVKRKTQKKINNKAKIIIVVLVLLVTATFVLLSKPKIQKPQSSDDTVYKLLTAEKDDIASITIKPKRGREYTIEYTANDNYTLHDKTDFLFDKSLVDSIFDTACFWETHYKIAENLTTKELEEFGIKADSLKVKIDIADNKTYTFYFGDKINIEIPLRYIYAQHEKTLYATKINYTDIYNFTLEELHTVPAINFSSDLVDKITINTDKKSIVLTRREDLWSFKSPLAYPLSKSSGKQLGNNIEKMRLATFETLATESNIQKYGLEKPQAVIIFDIAQSIVSSQEGEKIRVPAHQIQFDIGNEIEGIGFYCLYEGNIYKITKLSLGFLLDMRIDDMLLTTPANIAIDRLENLIIIKNNKKTEYSLNFTENVLPNNEIEKEE